MTLSGSIERPRIIFAPWGWLETVAVVVVTRLDDAFAPDEVITWTTALWAANMIRQHRMINPDMASQPRRPAGRNAFVELRRDDLDWKST